MKDIVVFAWNGRDKALPLVDFDAAPEFSIYLFDYSGSGLPPQLDMGKSVAGVFSHKTEFKGALLGRLQQATVSIDYRYIGILDDDHEISISAINRLLQAAAPLQADAFQPSLTADSFCSHRYFLQKPGAGPERIRWIEIMAPFLRKEIFDAAAPFYAQSISSYGIDRFVYPYVQRKLGMDRTFLIHEVALRHIKPVTSGFKPLSHGYDPMQEYEQVRRSVVQRIRAEGIRFSWWEQWKIFEIGRPPVLRWRDDFFRWIAQRQGKR